MRCTLYHLIALTMLLAVGCQNPSPPPGERPPADVTGTITDLRTAKPCPGAAVHLVGTTWGAMTGPQGNYRIVNPPPGMYTIRISCVGYQTLDFENVTVGDIPVRLDASLKDVVTDLHNDPVVKSDTSGRGRP